MSDVAYYQNQINRRRNWEVIKPSSIGFICNDAIPTLQRCLALRCLEMPVASWLEEEMSKGDMPETVIKLLRQNQKDEVKHDEVLNNLVGIFPVPDKLENEAQQIAQMWNSLASMFSPILTAGIIESSVFFVILPIYRFMGSKPMRTVANDISNDENIHVATNIKYSIDKGYNRNTKLDEARKITIDWLLSDLNEYDATDVNYSASKWRKASYNLYHNGYASELSETRAGVMPAFFETSNDKLPIYG